jgi:hypothetical protein
VIEVQMRADHAIDRFARLTGLGKVGQIRPVLQVPARERRRRENQRAATLAVE